ncbi:hypothetical protein JOB18_019526 [Solea senegalensis]|nr:hypothetical protein JOB18_019526 [Solea senegalensis]
MSDGQTARQMHSFVSACHKPSLVGSMTLDIVIFLRIQVHEKGLEVSTPGYYLQVLGATFGRMQLIKMTSCLCQNENTENWSWFCSVLSDGRACRHAGIFWPVTAILREGNEHCGRRLRANHH